MANAGKDRGQRTTTYNSLSVLGMSGDVEGVLERESSGWEQEGSR